MALLPSARPAIDVREVAVGTWAEYRHTRPGGTDFERFALVGDSADGRLLEVEVKSEAFRQPVLFRFVLPRQPGARTTSSPLEMQVGNQEPVRAMLPEGPLFADFLSPQAKTGTQEINVGGQRVKVTRYRHQIAEDVWEYWVSPQAAPLGFVRSSKQIGGTTSTLLLLRFGKGAIPRLTRPSKSVEGRAIAQALEANMRPAGR
jgi:hypothetical protein